MPVHFDGANTQAPDRVQGCIEAVTDSGDGCHGEIIG